MLLKIEKTEEFKMFINHLNSFIEEHIELKGYPYKHHYLMHSFNDEFILKIMLYPKVGKNEMTKIATIKIKKEVNNVSVNYILTSTMESLTKKESIEYLEKTISKNIDEYHYRLNLNRYKIQQKKTNFAFA